MLLSLTLLALAGDASASTPRVAVFYGGELAKDVVFDDWEQNVDLVSALTRGQPVKRAEVRGRPFVHIAVFWTEYVLAELRRGITFEEWVARDIPLGLRMLMQRGRLYPASHGRPAAVVLPWSGRWPRAVDAEGLALLARHGVPVQVRAESESGIGLAAAALALVTAGLAIAGRRRIRRRYRAAFGL